MSTYYRTCPDCGCNLDPGEICDCKKIWDLPSEPIASDALIIGYDFSKGIDVACLTIGRKNGDHIIILKEIIGIEAIKTYEDLTNGPCVKYDPHMEAFLKKSFNIPQK